MSRRTSTPMPPANVLSALAFFRGLPAGPVAELAAHAEAQALDSGDFIVRQHDAATRLFFLRSGRVQFLLRFEGVDDLLVGSADEPGMLIGWSAFRPPYRYTASVRCDGPCSVVTLPRSRVDEVVDREPAFGYLLLGRVAKALSDRIEDARRLLADPPVAGPPDSRSTRGAVTNPRELLGRSILFEHVDPRHLDALAAGARTQRLTAGTRLFAEGDPARQLFVLVSGAVQLSFQSPGSSGAGSTRHPIEVIRHAGRPIGWSSMVEPYRYRATATALEASELIILNRSDLDGCCRADPSFGVAFTQQLLSVLGNRLRALRVRLVARRYDEEIVAVEALLEQSAETLPVTSSLHKLPHYLRSRLTQDDAFLALATLQEHGTEAERSVASLCLDILSTVRREMQLYRDLQRIYEHVAAAPETTDPAEIRRRCSEDFVQLFDRMDYVIAGEEHLPDRPGFIVVMNHLKNHPDNTLPNDFQLTLDTHFVSSMILFRRYGEAPVRVIRKSRPDEFQHQAYYDRLGYLYVYRGDVDNDDVPGDPLERRRAFLDAGRRVLRSGTTLVICPEGTSLATEDSPTTLRPGAFRLAASVQPEPLIVPVAVANFDKRITRTRLTAIVFPPFRLSECLDALLGKVQDAIAALGDVRTDYRIRRTVRKAKTVSKNARTMSAAQRKAVSERMKKYWAARRKAKR